MSLRKEVLSYCSELGLDNVGIIKCRVFEELQGFYEERKLLDLENEFEEKDIEKRINPKHYMEEGKSIISIAFPYICVENNLNTGFSVYTKGYDYHKVVKSYLDKICAFLEEKGYKATGFVDSNTLPERYIAYLSGIGFIGKNNMIITNEFGSYVFLGEIITDAEIYSEDKRNIAEINKFSECGKCTVCFDECPTKAINTVKRNCNICLSYLTQKKELSNWEMNALNGRLFGCDSCQLKCPYNLNAKMSNIKEFNILDFMNNQCDDYIISMGNAEFKETFKLTSCGWRGKNILKRNAIIRKGIYKKEKVSGIKSDSDYINKYIERLL